MEQEIGGIWPDERWPQFILNNLPVGVMTVTADLLVNYMNPMAEHLTGRSAAESLGRPCGSVLQGGLCSKECPLRQIISRERSSIKIETTIVQKGGRIIPVSLRSAIMLDEQDRLLGAVELFTDISHIKKLEKDRAQTLSMFAHDMKSPLIAVGGLVQRLIKGKAGELNPDQRQYLDIVNGQLQRVQSMALDFLDTARLGKHGPKLVTAPTDLEAMLRGLEPEYGQRAREAGLELVLSAPGTLPEIQADPQRLLRVFTNLLDNALKFAQQGEIRVELAASGEDQVLIRVSDQGPGFKDKDLEELFTPFFRGSAGKGVEGTGLGLAAVKAIVQAHGGSVLAENAPGGGAVFTVYLPAPRGGD